MNNRFIRILATNALLAATLATTLTASVGCAAKRTQVTIPASETQTVITETTVQETMPEAKAVEQVEKIDKVSFDLGEPATTETSAPETTAAKQNAKKATKNTKKTAKKSTKKSAKKSTKKTAKKSAQKQEEYYTYGKSKYVRDIYSAVMNIKKDDTAKIMITRSEVDDDGTKYIATWSISGKIDKQKGLLTYTNCTKKMYKITSKAKLQETSYTNGYGTIDFFGSYFRWRDNRGREAMRLKIDKV